MESRDGIGKLLSQVRSHFQAHSARASVCVLIVYKCYLHDHCDVTSLVAQVGDPMHILKKGLCQQAVPEIADLRKLLKSCHALFQLAEALSQDVLKQTLESIISFLCAWFDFEEQAHGILLPGNEELDTIKAQYMELPNLLRRVCS